MLPKNALYNIIYNSGNGLPVVSKYPFSFKSVPIALNKMLFKCLNTICQTSTPDCYVLHYVILTLCCYVLHYVIRTLSCYVLYYVILTLLLHFTLRNSYSLLLHIVSRNSYSQLLRITLRNSYL